MSEPIASPQDARSLLRLLDECLIKDRHALRRELTRLLQKSDAGRLEGLAKRLDASRTACAARRARLPEVRYPEELPVSGRREEIAAAIAASQVVIVCGETGSGKTTQLPKLCLELGRGVAGMIAHTQPRRIAARTVAARIAQELGTELGDLVGFRVRFNDRVSDENFIRVMTDGILLAETQTDRYLSAYDTILIDEAHERSLNIDFLLGYLKQVLARRPELKLIITSATLDAQRFSAHFGNAPVVEVSGRLYPVEIRYRPPAAADEGEEEQDLIDRVVDVIDDLAHRPLGGDILVFLPGEREIREAAEALRKRHPPHTEILPLFARLSAAEQERVFQVGGGRRIVLSTNVAETSLTVPGIRYVVDSGLARVNRYSYRNKVEMLQIEPVSRASADQRAGRCGRVMNGICVRLYSEEDYAARPAFTDPEILRSSLASVILRMKALRLGAPEDFPFVEVPAARAIADGYQLLVELAAVDEEHELTAIGAQLARLPIDPRLARMIVAGRDHQCLSEVLIIAAGLSLQDPRERPLDRQYEADQAHAHFLDEKSEFVSYLKLWAFYEEALAHRKSHRKLVETCRERFLNALRLREWRELHAQLLTQLAETGWKLNEKPASYEALHQALLCGLLGNIGCRSEEPGVFLGARGIKFALFPGSSLRRKPPPWVVAAELTETSRLYARCIATIDPAWLERAGAHLSKRTLHDPHWEKSSGQAVAYERVTVYGLVVVSRRRVVYGLHFPVEAREIFLREALVHGEIRTKGDFLRRNLDLRQEVEELEHKSRRHDVLVDESRLYDFYDERVPAEVWNTDQFERWRQAAERQSPRLLWIARGALMLHGADEITEERFPDALMIQQVSYPVTYRFEPAHELDGVTLHVPLHLLNQVDQQHCEWLVPGMLREKLTQLLKGLPKTLRKNLVPVPQVVTACLERLDAQAGEALPVALARALRQEVGAEVPVGAFELDALPPFLRMNYRVLDETGAELAQGRDLASLRAELGVKARRQFSESAGREFERRGLTSWDFGELPEQAEFTRAGHQLIGYPALLDERDSVSLRLLDNEWEAARASRRGLRRLFQLAAPDPVKHLARNVPAFQQLCLGYALLLELESGRADKGTIADRLREEILEAACDRAFFVEDTPVRSREVFLERVNKARARLAEVGQEVARVLAEILNEYQVLRPRLNPSGVPAWTRAMADIRAQLRELFVPGFLLEVPLARLRHYPRYLRAIGMRLDKFPINGARDAQWQQEIARLAQAWQARAQADHGKGLINPALDEFRWLLEELRVSLWAQQLKTPVPVSLKRLERQWQELAR